MTEVLFSYIVGAAVGIYAAQKATPLVAFAAIVAGSILTWAFLARRWERL